MSKGKKNSKFSLDLSELLGSRIVGNAGGHGLGLYGKFVKKAVTYDLKMGGLYTIQNKLEALDSLIEKQVRIALKAIAYDKNYRNIQELSKTQIKELPENVDITLGLDDKVVLNKNIQLATLRKNGCKIAIETSPFHINIFSLSPEKLDFDVVEFKNSDTHSGEVKKRTFYIFEVIDPFYDIDYFVDDYYLSCSRKGKWPLFFSVRIGSKEAKFMLLSKFQAKFLGAFITLAFQIQPTLRYKSIFDTTKLYEMLRKRSKETKDLKIDFNW